jgi:hypothetical protein
MRSKERRDDLWRRPSLMTDLDSTIRWGLLWKYASGPSSKWITSLYFPSKGPTYMVQLVHEFGHFARYISKKKSYIHFSSHNLSRGCNLVPDFAKRAPSVPQLVCAGELGPNSPNQVPRRLELADSLFAN